MTLTGLLAIILSLPWFIHYFWELFLFNHKNNYSISLLKFTWQVWALFPVLKLRCDFDVSGAKSCSHGSWHALTPCLLQSESAPLQLSLYLSLNLYTSRGNLWEAQLPCYLLPSSLKPWKESWLSPAKLLKPRSSCEMLIYLTLDVSEFRILLALTHCMSDALFQAIISK